jgi:cytochrome c-type biogenesis protein CcmH
MKRTSILTAFCLVMVAASSRAQSDSARMEAEVKEIETLLIAPCCWRQPIADHDSEVAKDMKEQVRKMLVEGKSRQEILDSYVEQYGARILSIPPQVGFNRLSFLMPVLFIIAGFVVVGAFLRKWGGKLPGTSSHRAANEAEPMVQPLDDEMSHRIQKEMEDME